MSPNGVKVLKFCKKYFFSQNPRWPLVAGPVPGLAFKGLKLQIIAAVISFISGKYNQYENY